MEKKILCVGLTCLDFVSFCEKFPAEDSDTRCLSQKWVRGGNASNNCTVLRQLGANCEFLGTVANNPMSRFLTEDLVQHGINIDHIVWIDGSDCPCATVIINNENGSRTILVASKDLPELTFNQFKNAVNLGSGLYRWIHFEARYDIPETKQMLKSIDEFNSQLPDESKKIITSVEIEKCRSVLGGLVSCAQYVFISKDYAKFCGYHSKEEAVEKVSSKIRDGATIICAWGETGAAAKTTSTEIITVPCYPPKEVVDTLGAGDTFVASTIFALSRGDRLKDAINYGCQVAGAKVGMRGFDGLGSIFNS